MSGMNPITLYCGNRNYSSWSLRPWIAMRHLGLTFETRVMGLGTPEFRSTLGSLDVAGRVPVLVHGGVRVWDSLAICEYVNEIAGGKGWPAEPAARATARSVSAEMHSGFQCLRTEMPMNIRARRSVPMTPALQKDIARVEATWTRLRTTTGGGGPWLFGNYTIADAMFAPVALRFATYGVELGAIAASYRDTVIADPLMADWIEGARAESWVLPASEVGADVA
jgi:glutathione S-transferase